MSKHLKLMAKPKTNAGFAAALGSADATEADYCEICTRERARCCCRGIQPYAMSVYPGEHNLVPTHPANGGEQWYKRDDVDAKLDELEKRMSAQPNDPSSPTAGKKP
jgi:hypothetical protein